MNNFLFLIVGFVLGFIMAWIWFANKIKEARRVEKEIQKEREVWYGFSEFNEKMAAIKAERKEKIMDELKKINKMSTAKAADLLNISRATAFRYLEELQKENIIEQVGNMGRDVVYKIRQN